MLASAAVLASFGFNFYQPNLPLYALELGIDIATLGLIYTVAALVTVPLALTAGVLADRYGRKPMIVLSYGFATLGVFMAFVARGLAEILLSTVFFVASFFMGVSSRNPLVMESVPIEYRGRAISLVVMGFTLPSIPAPFLGGWLAPRIGFRGVFLASTVVYAGATALTSLFLVETLKPGVRQPLSITEFLKPGRRLLPLYPFVMMDRAAWTLWMRILNAHLAELYGYGPWEIGILTSVRNAAWFLGLYPFGELADKFNRWTGLALSESLGIAALIALTVGGNMYVIGLGWLLIGLSISSWIPAYNSFIGDLTTESERAKEFSKINTARSLMEVPMPSIGGYLHDKYSPESPFVLGTILMVIALAYLGYIVGIQRIGFKRSSSLQVATA